MSRKVLIIDNYDSFVYNLIDEFKLADCEVMTYRNDVDYEALKSVIQKESPSLIVLSPGPGHPKDAGHCIQLLKDCKNNNGVPPSPYADRFRVCPRAARRGGPGTRGADRFRVRPRAACRGGRRESRLAPAAGAARLGLPRAATPGTHAISGSFNIHTGARSVAYCNWRV